MDGWAAGRTDGRLSSEFAVLSATATFTFCDNTEKSANDDDNVSKHNSNSGNPMDSLLLLLLLLSSSSSSSSRVFRRESTR